jgi:hypothetical protein
MIKCVVSIVILNALPFFLGNAFGQSGSNNFGKIWVQGEGLTYSTTFNSGLPPVNQITFLPQTTPPYLTSGNTNICDSSGNLVLISDGFGLYDKNLNLLDGGQLLVPSRIAVFEDGFSALSQTSIILPFRNGKYRLVTPTVSDDSCYHNWENVGNGAAFDLLLYDEVDMNANGGAGKVTKRMVPLLQNVRLSKTQMMACRHGDGKSWWLLKQALDTNLVYKFLFTEDSVYGPYVQGFSGASSHFGFWDIDGQAMFSKDGTRYATAIQGYGHVFVADFDRCSGMLSNPIVYKVPARPIGNPFGPPIMDSSTCGLAFSPNGRYLYVSGYYNVQQLALGVVNPSLQWTLLSGLDTGWQEFQLYSNIYPGPDDKLYIGNWNGIGGQMSVINSPDSNGTSADFCRKCLRFPGYVANGVVRYDGVSIPPCMPNYGLGPTNPICYPTKVSTSLVNDLMFLIYPNPSDGFIEAKSSETGILLLYDITGRLVNSTTIIQTGTSTLVNLRNLPPGVYQYRFTGKSKQCMNGKLVVKQ